MKPLFIKSLCNMLFLAMSCWIYFVLPAQAQTPIPPLELTVGDIIAMKTETTKKEWRKGIQVRDEHHLSKGTLEIVATMENGYAARATALEARSEGGEPQATAAMQAVNKAVIGQPIEYQLNEQGGPVLIVGWRDLVKTIFATVKGYSEQKFDADQAQERAAFDQIMASIEQTWLNFDEPTAAAVLGQELALWSVAHNAELALGEPFETNTVGANAFGGAPINYDTVYELVSIGDGEAVITVKQRADEDAIKGMISALLHMVKVPDDKMALVRAELVKQGVELTFDQRHIVSLETGMTSSVEEVKTMLIGDVMRRVDVRKITAIRQSTGQ